MQTFESVSSSVESLNVAKDIPIECHWINGKDSDGTRYCGNAGTDREEAMAFARTVRKMYPSMGTIHLWIRSSESALLPIYSFWSDGFEQDEEWEPAGYAILHLV